MTECIAIDAMGGDHGPEITIEGTALAQKRNAGLGLTFQLHGDQSRIEPCLHRFAELKAVSTIIHSEISIGMDEKPANVLRRRGSSLHNAIGAVKDGSAKAIVSAGNTGALMALSKMILKMRLDDLERPAIACLWPHRHGLSTVLDVGANVSSDARQLVEFALMGSAFHKAMRGVERPKIGLLNVGSEDVKGHEEVREAHRILREEVTGLNYFGFVEGDDLFKGTVDVIVADGFTGNVALKTAEGTARFIKDLLKTALTSSLLAKLGAALAASALKRTLVQVDPAASNGGPLLGLNGIVIKSHGGANAYSFSNAVNVAISLANSSFSEDIARDLAGFSTHLGHQATAPLAEKVG